MKNYSIKEYYQFVEYLSGLSNINLPHERLKQISLDSYKAESEEEIAVKKIANSYLYALSNINQVINKEILSDKYYLLTKKYLKDNQIIKILEEYYKYFDESIHYLVAKVHFKVLEVVKEKAVEMAFILSNLIMIKRKRGILIPHTLIHINYKKAIKQKNINSLLYILAQIESKHTRKNHKKISKKEIEEFFKNNKNIKEKFKIEKLFLYGSYASGKANKESDLDLLIIYQENLINKERNNNTKKLKSFLQNQLREKIDILDFSFAVKNLNIGGMENLITLIN